MPDITQVILDEHDWFRRAFAALDETTDRDELAVLWRHIEMRLEVHAEAEEEILYPVLLDVGRDAEDETDDAIGDHNEIREASHRTHDLQAGTEEWWEAVRAAREENSDHMGEEERDALADLRRTTTPDQRHDLGRRFLVFLATRMTVEVPDDHMAPEPEDYIEQHTG